MKWYTSSPAKDRPILIKCYEPTELGYYYYVVEYNEEMSSYNYEETYTEYLGHRHAHWTEDEIIAWTDFDELTKDFAASQTKYKPKIQDYSKESLEKLAASGVNVEFLYATETSEYFMAGDIFVGVPVSNKIVYGAKY